MNCIFCKIARHEMPKEFTYEDDEVMVFPDTHPIKPVHLLIIPKKHIPDFLDLSDEDNELLIHTRKVAQRMIRENGLVDKGYRLVINGGRAQIVDHLHIHLSGPWGIRV
ncbi:MAG TPA: HIT domain-containing protein [Patescibacteria group bacterium]|nr:HIT domain-containing protein [Patescibacteria group bacterium]